MAQTPIIPPKLHKGVRTLIVMGGSFDPPHSGHFGPVRSAMVNAQMRDAAVLIVPAARSPHKPAGTSATDRHRVAMLRVLTRRAKNLVLWLDEIRRAKAGEPSYTVDTLRRLRLVIPEQIELRLLIGADQAAAFHAWREPREIIALAEPLVLRRRPITTAAELAGAIDRGYWSKAEIEAWGTRLARNSLAADSSTAIRAAIPNAPADVRKWARKPGLRFVDPKVARYILKHGLYGYKKPPAKAGGLK